MHTMALLRDLTVTLDFSVPPAVRKFQKQLRGTTAIQLSSVARLRHTIFLVLLGLVFS